MLVWGVRVLVWGVCVLVCGDARVSVGVCMC